MGKKRSRFVQQQKNNQRLQNKSQSNMNHRINQTNKKIETFKQDYENSVKEIMSNFIKENGLDPEKIPNNSRIIIFELLRKNIQNKLDMYNQYISEHQDDKNIQEYYDAQTVCTDTLEQIDWIYDWTRPLNNEKYILYDGYDDLLEKASKKLEDSGKKFESLNSALEVIDKIVECNRELNLLHYSFFQFCYFIEQNDVDKYYIYISNTIKNLMVLESNDPIVDFLLKDFKKEDVEITEECES
jgi:hypothetical protein